MRGRLARSSAEGPRQSGRDVFPRPRRPSDRPRGAPPDEHPDNYRFACDPEQSAQASESQPLPPGAQWPEWRARHGGGAPCGKGGAVCAFFPGISLH